MRESREQARRRITANVEAIRRYIEMRERIHKGTAGSSFNLESDRQIERGVPLTAWAMRFLSDPKSSDARTVLEPVLQDVADQQPGLYWAIRDVQADPGIVRRWEEDNRDRLRVYGMACRLIAVKLEVRMPGVRVVVNVDPRDEPLVKEGAPHHRQRRYDAEHTYRLIAEYFKERLAATGDIGTAEYETARRFDCSPRKVRMARQFKNAS